MAYKMVELTYTQTKALADGLDRFIAERALIRKQAAVVIGVDKEILFRVLKRGTITKLSKAAFDKIAAATGVNVSGWSTDVA